MTRSVRCFAAAVLFAGSVALAADDKPADPAPTKPAKVDWSKYATVSEVVGTVAKAGPDGFTLRTTWYAPSGGGGGRRSRPRPPKEQHTDYDLSYAEGGMVRWNKLSLMPGRKKGDFVSPAEQDKLKQPSGAPGWAADRDALTVGHIVEVTLVRPREVPAAKATTSDLRVKYAVIHGEDPNPPVLTKK